LKDRWSAIATGIGKSIWRSIGKHSTESNVG
jgi:hypothetical protein